MTTDQRGQPLDSPPDIGAFQTQLHPVTFDVASESDLRSALLAAESDASEDIAINLTTSITLNDATAGQLVIDNPTSIPKAITIEGQATSPLSTTIAGSGIWNTRIFEIVGTGPASLAVFFRDLVITGGKAHDSGTLSLDAAVGGGMLIDGGQVTLSDMSVANNSAIGAPGLHGSAGVTGMNGNDGATGGAGGLGTSGTPGGNAAGGGIYMQAGQLTLNNVAVDNNRTIGGSGGAGGQGGGGGSGGTGGGGINERAVGGAGGAGGDGLPGGSAAGGGLYMLSGDAVFNQFQVEGNLAEGGGGGAGGRGGDGKTGGHNGPAVPLVVTAAPAAGLVREEMPRVVDFTSQPGSSSKHRRSLASPWSLRISPREGSVAMAELGEMVGPARTALGGGAGDGAPVAAEGGQAGASGQCRGGGLYLATGQLDLSNSRTGEQSGQKEGREAVAGPAALTRGEAMEAPGQLTAVMGAPPGPLGIPGMMGQGGPGGTAQGGGLYVGDARVDMGSMQFSANGATGGAGWTGPSGVSGLGPVSLTVAPAVWVAELCLLV